jgi:hypothetical protein
MIFVQKSDKWQIVSQSMDSCSLAPKFGTEQLHEHRSALPTFTTDFNQGCDPQQQW